MRARLAVLGDAVTLWRALVDEAVAVLGDKAVQHPRLALQTHSHKADAALAALAAEVDAPVITLAVAGTTSSGKSSLVNFLCGAEYVPVSVQEMSAGVVRLSHAPAPSRCRVVATAGATWPCGEFTEDAASIRRRLADVFKAWREAPEGVQAPEIHVEAPLRVGDPQVLGLPMGARVRLLDLPGLKFVGDEKNAAVFRAEVSRGLCILVANAEDTDPVKREACIGQIVDQIKELRATPARVLFVGNRIDAFLKNQRDNPNAKDEWLSAVSSGARKALNAVFPEHQAAIDQLTILPLSSMPACRAVALRDAALRDDEVDVVMDDIDIHWRGILPPAVRRDVTTTPSAAQRASVATALFEHSGALAFESRLREHLAMHLPSLLLPQHERAVRGALQAGVSALATEVSTRLDLAGRQHDDALAQLRRAEQAMVQMRERMRAAWAPLTDDVASGLSVKDRLKAVCELLAVEHTQVAALHEWEGQLKGALADVMGAVYGRLRGEQAPLAVAAHHDRQLSDACAVVRAAGYSGAAIKREGDMDTLTDFARAVRVLGHAVGNVAQAVVQREASFQAERVVASFGSLTRAQATRLDAEARRSDPELHLSCMRLPEALEAVRPPPLVVAVTMDVDVDEKTRNVHREVIVKRKGFWSFLDLITDKKETITEKHKYYILSVPDLDGLMKEIEEKVSFNTLRSAFHLWMREQVAAWDAHVTRLHADHAARAVAAFEALREQRSDEHDRRLAPLRELQQRCLAAQSALDRGSA